MIYELAGLVGVDPSPLTLRQLAWMAGGRRQHDWGVASSLMALLAEIHRDRKRRGRPFKPAEFNPLVAARSRPILTTVTQLASLLGLPVQPHATGDGQPDSEVP